VPVINPWEAKIEGVVSPTTNGTKLAPKRQTGRINGPCIGEAAYFAGLNCKML
jgi:hypothetical protein